MTTDIAEAIYEDGVLRPLCDLELREGERVTLTVKREEKPREKPRLTPEEYIALARKVYEGLSEEEIDEIEATFKRPLDMFVDLE